MNYIKLKIKLIRNDISSLYNKLNKRFDELNNINLKNQEIQYNDGKYIGQAINGIANGKGILYGINGDRYEGDWRNGKFEGKGIYYFNNGERYEGDWRNGKQEGKGIYYFNSGNRYEGDFRNGKK